MLPRAPLLGQCTPPQLLQIGKFTAIGFAGAEEETPQRIMTVSGRTQNKHGSGIEFGGRRGGVGRRYEVEEEVELVERKTRRRRKCPLRQPSNLQLINPSEFNSKELFSGHHYRVRLPYVG